jgi:Protein of unknown function (DUF3667)
VSASSTLCLNCDTALVGPRCHICGQPGKTARLTTKHLLHEIPHSVFHVDRGLLPTLYWLALRPGRTINAYLDGKRARYFNPLSLLMIMAGLNTLLYSVFPLQFTGIGMAPGSPVDQAALQSGMTLIYRYYALSFALLLPLMAAASWLCFLGRGRCFGEHLTIQAFLSAFLAFFGISIFVLLWVFEDSRYSGWIWAAYSILSFGYFFFTMAATFWHSGRVWSTLLRAAMFVIVYTLLNAILLSAALAAYQYYRGAVATTG